MLFAVRSPGVIERYGLDKPIVPASAKVRRMAILMWTVGGLLAILGLAIDLDGGWADLPFLTNLISSLAGALIGIPFALLVVQRIVAQYLQRSSRESATAALYPARQKV